MKIWNLKLLTAVSLTNQLNVQNFRPHYNLNLQSISVSGQPLDINPSVFATSSNKGTIVDTGTTLAYLTEDAYDPLVNAVSYSEEIISFLLDTFEQSLEYF